MKRLVLIALGGATLFNISCKSSKPVAQTPVKPTVEEPQKPATERPVYREANKRVNDLLHTKLEVSFDYAKQYLYGKATLTVKPYFYPSFYLDLDAVGMELKKVELITPSGNEPLVYKYDGKVITITLDRIYRNDEQFKVYVEYTAKPNEVDVQGSAAINDAKGLYFINPTGKDKNKPKQIWTQGETQANSVWFPTIDSPNERMTQEIYMTVDTGYVTLSNGLLVSSKSNGNGTRTDYWKQSLPAAPYLTMMVVGKFSIIKSKWRKMDVNYYVEPEYEKVAKTIFGNTPEMLEFFSNKLGVDYPWEKFSQIVVRDYVSGAMENTTAVLHGEYLQRNERELLDGTNEDVISHELFHQWFGDLVTCESWSNVPLNESFATYGEYLWNEYKYGLDEADNGLQKDMAVYMAQSKNKNVDLIRYDYEDKEDMFDGISYQKGGRILHMLRKYVGDDAFFSALKLYLTTNKFKPVEVHNLRLAFEEITGEDLNWFFNQWFLNHGHPILNIEYAYNDTTKKETVTVEQIQDLTKAPIYRIPVDIELYFNGKTESHRVVINKTREKFTFDVSKKPDLVNFDRDKMLLAVKNDNKTSKELSFQYYNGPLYMDRYEAIQTLAMSEDSNLVVIKPLLDALNDKHWNIRQYAIRNSGKILSVRGSELRRKLVTLAKEDPKSDVRAAAIAALVKSFEGQDLIALYKEKTNDKSYMVVGAALDAYSQKNPKEALAIAKGMESDKSAGAIKAVTGLYISKGTDEQNQYISSSIDKIKGQDLYIFVQSYGRFLLNCTDKTVLQSLKTLDDLGRNANAWYVRLSAVQTLSEIAKRYETKELEQKANLEKLTKEAKPAEEIGKAANELTDATKRKNQIEKIVESIKEGEKDPNLTRIYGTAKDKE